MFFEQIYEEKSQFNLVYKGVIEKEFKTPPSIWENILT